MSRIRIYHLYNELVRDPPRDVEELIDRAIEIKSLTYRGADPPDRINYSFDPRHVAQAVRLWDRLPVRGIPLPTRIKLWFYGEHPPKELDATGRDLARWVFHHIQKTP